ncbi:MAG: ThuA domain-containing protein [Verrucomicrobiota bacterium]
MRNLIHQILLGAALLAVSATAADKKLVVIAGRPSHGPGEHEFRAGSLLLQKCLANAPGLVTVTYSNGWPQDAAALSDATAVVIYADGGGGHPVLKDDHKAVISNLVKQGVGIGFMHYTCEVPADKAGTEFKEWVGGHYEHQYSCNPMWEPDYTTFPKHPAANGVMPFKIRDEWYFNIRFRDDMSGITPILVAKPSDQVRDGSYVYPKGPYTHIQQNKGRDEIMMWVVENPGGSRGFGFTGGHYHKNWGEPNFRKVVLNALLWVTKVEVPAGGVDSLVSAEMLTQNLDPKNAPKPKK